MATVQEIMTDPVFEGFRIVAGRRGMYNNVSGTGVFDWEEPSDVETTFAPGEFVITTLSEAKYRPDELLTRMQALLNIHVSAICIKTLFFKSVPEEITELANKKNIPVFLFEDTYIDDVIYVVRNGLASQERNDEIAEQVEELLWEERAVPEEAAKIMRRISPVLYENFACVYLRPRFKKDIRSGNLIREHAERLTSFFQDWNIDLDLEFCEVVSLRDAIVILCSCKENRKEEELYKLVDRIIRELDMTRRFIAGISNTHFRHGEFGAALKESMYASVSAVIDRETILKYGETGLDALLIPMWDNGWIRNTYETEIDKLQQYDRKNNAKLFETLLTYTESEGSVSLTASKLVQHENTVRHRLERIRETIGTDEQEKSYVHMYMIARLYKIMKVMTD